jgi:hypothetical protein
MKGPPPGGPFVFWHHVAVKKASILALLALALVAPAAATTGQGLYGVVTRSPTKPVCSSEEPCSGPAAHTKLRFFRGTRFVSSVVTDAGGRYRVRLPRGLYRIRVAGAPASGIGSRIEPAKVSVRAAWRRQNFDIDTGIR